ncbi:hypothetical protein J6590_005234 [Homalodisca vitripennis]|nr:hypothetical protein J6590_005234 [Homalodisca vitripennis]
MLCSHRDRFKLVGNGKKSAEQLFYKKTTTGRFPQLRAVFCDFVTTSELYESVEGRVGRIKTLVPEQLVIRVSEGHKKNEPYHESNLGVINE